jgi:hypothetical protein
MNKQELWNRITSNGCREMTEERFYQALDELSIPATERERMIAKMVLGLSGECVSEQKRLLSHFFESPAYTLIPPALNFEQELEGRMPTYEKYYRQLMESNDIEQDYNWLKTELKGKQ